MTNVSNFSLVVFLDTHFIANTIEIVGLAILLCEHFGWFLVLTEDDFAILLLATVLADPVDKFVILLIFDYLLNAVPHYKLLAFLVDFHFLVVFAELYKLLALLILHNSILKHLLPIPLTLLSSHRTLAILGVPLQRPPVTVPVDLDTLLEEHLVVGLGEGTGVLGE